MALRAIQEELPEVKKIISRRSKSRFANGRWVIVALFFTTALASLFFYFKTEIPLIWQKIAAPAVVSTLPGKLDPTSVLNEVKSLTGDFGEIMDFMFIGLRVELNMGLRRAEFLRPPL